MEIFAIVISVTVVLCILIQRINQENEVKHDDTTDMYERHLFGREKDDY